jgi:hypothetical protein
LRGHTFHYSTTETALQPVARTARPDTEPLPDAGEALWQQGQRARQLLPRLVSLVPGGGGGAVFGTAAHHSFRGACMTQNWRDHPQGPQRIVCMTEETTEWLYLLGQEHRIVGISGYTVRPTPRAGRKAPRERLYQRQD